MNVQGIILTTTGVLASGFMLFLLCRLATFEGHRNRVKSVKQDVAKVENVTPSGPRFGRGDSFTEAELSDINLRRLLQKLSRTPQPARRGRLISRARKRSDEFEPHLVHILSDEADELILPAITLAGETDLKAGILPLTVLASSDEVAVRVRAIYAKNVIDPWSNSELAAFLRETDPEVLTAALKIVSTRRVAPVRELTALLSHDKAVVRSLAASCMPALPPGDQLDELYRMAEGGTGKTAWAAADALGRPGFSDKTEKCLIGLLDREDSTLRRHALQALARKSSTIVDVDTLLRFIQSTTIPVRERALAFAAMESTLTIPTAKIPSLLPHLHPVLRLFGARCLCVAGDRAAVPFLIELLDTELTKNVTRNERQCAVLEAYDLLREFSGERLARDSSMWSRWHRENPEFVVCRLSPRPPANW